MKSNAKMENFNTWKHMIQLVIQFKSGVVFTPVTLSMLNNSCFAENSQYNLKHMEVSILSTLKQHIIGVIME